MLYEIRLAGAEQDDGGIDLQRLILLTQSVIDVAKGALQIRLIGVSTEKGRTAERISNALKIKLSNLKKGSTILALECDTFKETLEGLQGSVFNPHILEELPDQTPLSLVIHAFREALGYGTIVDKEEISHLDKGLLKRLRIFERVLVSANESLTISNNGSIPELILKKEDFKKIEELEESIPEPQQIILHGRVDELKYSKARVTIATKDGSTTAVFSDELEPQKIAKYWGKDVTISGTAHYQPNGKMSFVYIEKIFEPGEADAYFSRPSKKETVEQQIQRQQKQLRYTNNLQEIVGQWPGDESAEDIINGLD